METSHSENIKFILANTKLEDIIHHFVDLKKRGSNFLGLCPLHSEKSPSFVVSPSRQVFKCFGCGKSGNSITFIMQLKQYSSAQAVTEIAKLLNISLPYPEGKIIEKKSTESSKSTNDIFSPITINFEANVKAIIELMTFDKLLLYFCISQIEELDERIKNNDELKVTNIRFLPESTLANLKNIRENDSFKFKFNSINNQCLVLLISYFTSTVKQIFKDSLNFFAHERKGLLKNIDSDIKLSFADLEKYDFNLVENLGEIVINKKDISFQDMQSITREFKNYFKIDISNSESIDNIIFSQASRHAIVHSLGVADERFIKQISKTDLRTLKLGISQNDEIVFTESEIRIIISNLNLFIENLISLLGKRMN